MPLRLPRLARSAAIIGLAAVPVAAICAPAWADSVRQREWWLSALHVSQAWQTGAGRGITVAVLADGVDAKQPDLTGTVIQGPDYTRSGRPPGGRYYGFIGTALASLIVGHGHGAKDSSGDFVDGIHGIADNATVLSLRVTLSPGDPLWSSSRVTARLPGAIAAGIMYAVKHDAKIIELPADPGIPGLPGWGGIGAVTGGSAAERAAISYAVSKDVVLVAPAGDNAEHGDAVNYPAAYSGVIAVGAFAKGFGQASFSNRQGYVALTAPGQDVIAAAPNGYQTLNSTWAAGAMVAGISALIRSQFPNLTAPQVGLAMADSTVWGRDKMINGSGRGTVDARAAIAEASTMSPPHAHSAALGAMPKVRPPAPLIPTQAQAITGYLARDGAISGSLLAGLLVPISCYGLVARRREKRLALAEAERARQNRARPGPGGALADPLLEFFGPQHARPEVRRTEQRPIASPRFQPRPTLAGRSSLSARPVLASPGPKQVPVMLRAPVSPETATAPPSSAPSASSAPSSSASSGPSASPASPGLSGLSGQTAQVRPGGLPLRMPGTAGQAIPFGQSDAGRRFASPHEEVGPTVRHADVAGSPPWEPAPQPTTALPWTVIPGPSAGSAPRSGQSATARSAPPESVWEEPASRPGTPGRSLFASRPQSWPDASRPDPGRPDPSRPDPSRGDPSRAGSRPPESSRGESGRSGRSGRGESGRSGRGAPGRVNPGVVDPGVGAAPGTPAQADTGGRPIYVWNPGATEPSRFIADDSKG